MAVEISLDWNASPAQPDTPSTSGAVGIADALIASIRDKGRVEMPYIAALAGMDEGRALQGLGDAVFCDPLTLRWQLADKYLSGDVVSKLETAQAAETGDGRFARNIAALQRVLPRRVSAEEIYAALGAPWLPADVIEDFIAHLMAVRACVCRVLHDPATGSWTIKRKGAYYGDVASRQTWGTDRARALDILEGMLNGRDVRVTDEVECPENKTGKKRVVNQGETLAAQEKQSAIADEFSVWLWADPERAKRLEDIYNERYCGFVGGRYDGSVLSFPDMAPGVALRGYQKDSVLRMLLEPNVLLAHDVGAGKTYTCIAACMELRRLGISGKNLIIVPNNVLGQWKELFAVMYPGADVLTVSPRSFKPDVRQEVLADIRDGDHDAVIMAYSCFGLVPMSWEDELRALDARIDELNEAMKDPMRRTTALKRERRACARKRDELAAQGAGEDRGICFDGLGVTRLFVDEAHNFKNLRTAGGARVAGASGSGSVKCKHLLAAVRCVQRAGGGAVFATGTVLTNSIADCYVMQLYLQPGTLNLLDLQSFDSWAGMFAQRRTEWEIDVDTSTFRHATRFAGFGNLEALSSILACCADFHHIGAEEGLPACRGRQDVLVRRGEALDEYLFGISERADRVRRGRARRDEDNLLKICTDGRKAALDIRLVDGGGAPDAGGKVAACAGNVFRIWERTAAQRGAQLVFCDTSTPKAGFNVYDELKALLVGMDVPEGQIAFVHDAKSDVARARLFAAVRAGEVRVLVGSTFKLGLGVNVQDRLVAAHHLDVPWRPADMSQREGRILRQGNLNPEVEIFRYVTEGSFDAYSWQLLENKQRAIDELLSGTYEGGFLDSDIGDAALSYGEIKALAVNNPLLRERVETANELQRNLILQRKASISRSEMRAEVDDVTKRIEVLESGAERCREDAEFVAATAAPAYSAEQRASARKLLVEAVRGNAFKSAERPLVGRYRGFSVILPAGMRPGEPYLWLRRTGSYRVDLGGLKERGVLTRMDNVIEGLSARLEKMEAVTAGLYGRWEALEAELAKGADRSAKIRECREKLARIDLELEGTR